MILLPFISAGLYLLGGQVNKWFRWGMGIPIALITFFFYGHNWVSLLAIATYFIATNAFSYGDKMIWTKIFGKWVSMGLSGFMFGLASFPIIGYWAILNAVISCTAFLVLKYLDDTDKLKNPWQELLRGFLGTAILIFG